MTTPPEPEINSGSFGASLHQMLSDAYAKMLDQPYEAQPIILSPSGKAQYDQFKKLTAYMPVSCCQLTDSTGENHCEHPPIERPPIPWRLRVKWAINGRRRRLRMRLGSWIAGVDLDERDDW